MRSVDGNVVNMNLEFDLFDSSTGSTLKANEAYFLLFTDEFRLLARKREMQLQS